MPNSAAKRSMVIGVLRADCDNCNMLPRTAVQCDCGIRWRCFQVCRRRLDALAVCGCRSADCRLLRVCVGAAVEIADLGWQRDVFSGKAMRWVNHIRICGD